ncbi:MAG TPA: hypothetical protein VEH84_18900 [Alphaproteobacteria bacterium]|nr:hypothetical protein [Alphaproteobacteria bacterium]
MQLRIQAAAAALLGLSLAACGIDGNSPERNGAATAADAPMGIQSGNTAATAPTAPAAAPEAGAVEPQADAGVAMREGEFASAGSAPIRRRPSGATTGGDMTDPAQVAAALTASTGGRPLVELPAESWQ